MTLSEVPLETLNRYAAEKIGWLNVGSRWHSPACQRDEINCGGNLPDFTEPAGMKMLLEYLIDRVGISHAFDAVHEQLTEPERAESSQPYSAYLGHAVLEAFCLSEGFKVT